LIEVLIRMLERANQDGKAVMTDELRTKIEEIQIQSKYDRGCPASVRIQVGKLIS